MPTNDLKAKFEQDIKGATPKGADTLRENVRKRGSIPNMTPSLGKLTLNYFPVFAKGPAIAIALDIAGLDWEGVFIKPGGTMETLFADWADFKPTTSFGELPLLTTPDLGDIAHELAILNYIGRKTSLGGANDKEFCISGQLMQMAEDIFQKLMRVQPSFMDAKADIVAAGTTADFWDNTKLTEHNLVQGCAAYLAYLEGFHATCGAGSGRYTTSGTTVGEIKLFATLHMLVMLKPDCLDACSAVKKFYETVLALPAAKAVLENGSKFPGPFLQFFVNPP